MFPRAQISSEIAVWRKIEINRLLAVPVRRDLENRGPADAAMGEKHVFAKPLFRAASGSNHLGRNSCQIAPALRIPLAENERNQGSAGRLDLQSELPGQIVTKRGGANFCDGQASGSDHEAGGAEAGVLGLHGELVVFVQI